MIGIPKGTVWQQIRADSLDAISEGARLDFKHPATVLGWHGAGYYTVRGVGKRRLDLSTAADDLASALLGDAEHFLDHAVEHQVTVWQAMQAPRWVSGAWLIVTVYYWLFFVVLALSRLLGSTLVFLDAEAIGQMVRLGPAASPNPGGGAFLLQCGISVSLSEREISLTKRKGRLHDALWVWLEQRFNRLASAVHHSNVPEERFVTSLLGGFKKLGSDWPSAFRNLVNYNAGYAYDPIGRRESLDLQKFLRMQRDLDPDRAVDLLEDCLLAAAPFQQENINETARILVLFTFLLHALTLAVEEELLDRRGLDRRWYKARYRFLERETVVAGKSSWPW